MNSGSGTYRRRVLRNATANSIGNAWTMLVTFLALPFLLDGLGAEAFGLWALLLTFSASQGWFSLADLGVGVAATRFVAEYESVGDERSAGRSAGSALVIFVGLGAGLSAALAILGPWVLGALFDVPDDLASPFSLATRLWAVALFFELIGRWAQSVLEGVQRLDLARLGASLRQTLLAVATAAVATADGGLGGVAAASLVASIIATAVTTSLLLPCMGPGHWSVSRGESRRLLGYGSRVWLLNGVGVAHRTMDRIIVGVIMGPAAVSLVEIAARVQSAATAVLAATSYAAMSSAPWVKARQQLGQLQELLLRGTKYSVLATLPVVIALALLAEPLVDLWLGSEWSEAAGLIAIGLVYVAASSPLAVGSNMLQGGGEAGLVLRAAALALAVNLVTSVLLVNAVGIVGAYIGTLIGTAVLAWPLAAGFLTETGVRLGRFLQSSLLPALAPAVTMIVVIGIVLALDVGSLATLLAGGLAGAAGYALVAARWSFGPGELRGLLRDLTPGT